MPRSFQTIFQKLRKVKTEKSNFLDKIMSTCVIIPCEKQKIILHTDRGVVSSRLHETPTTEN